MHNRRAVGIIVLAVLVVSSDIEGNELEKRNVYRVADWPARYAKCLAVPLTGVKVQGYLGRRIDRNRASLLLGLKSPIPEGFEAAAAGTTPPKYRLAADSDLYKWLEGACYVFTRTGDQEVKQAIDRIAGLIVKC